MNTNEKQETSLLADEERAGLMRGWMTQELQEEEGLLIDTTDLWKDAVEIFQPAPPHREAGITPAAMARKAYPFAYIYLEGHDVQIYRFVDPLTLHDAYSEPCLARAGSPILQSIRIDNCGGKCGLHNLYIKNHWGVYLEGDQE